MSHHRYLISPVVGITVQSANIGVAVYLEQAGKVDGGQRGFYPESLNPHVCPAIHCGSAVGALKDMPMSGNASAGPVLHCLIDHKIRFVVINSQESVCYGYVSIRPPKIN